MTTSITDSERQQTAVSRHRARFLATKSDNEAIGLYISYLDTIEALAQVDLEAAAREVNTAIEDLFDNISTGHTLTLGVEAATRVIDNTSLFPYLVKENQNPYAAITLLLLKTLSGSDGQRMGVEFQEERLRFIFGDDVNLYDDDIPTRMRKVADMFYQPGWATLFEPELTTVEGIVATSLHMRPALATTLLRAETQPLYAALPSDSTLAP